MNKEELEAFAREAAKGLKTEKDLDEFSQMLTKVAVEAFYDDACVQMMRSFIADRPELWNEDIGV